jgi:hypothetical protein
VPPRLQHIYRYDAQAKGPLTDRSRSGHSQRRSATREKWRWSVAISLGFASEGYALRMPDDREVQKKKKKRVPMPPVPVPPPRDPDREVERGMPPLRERKKSGGEDGS